MERRELVDHGGYESHGLRFDVKLPYESVDEFKARMNSAARDEEQGPKQVGDDPQWLIGKQAHHRGSLYSDIWHGTAADLASRACIAIYSALKTRTRLEYYYRAARYSLVVSINALEVEVDLYAEVANRVTTTVATEF